MPPDNDIEVIQQVLHGQRNAYSTLVDRYQGYVFTVALKYVSVREVAEELAQDVFVKAYKSLPDFKGTSKFSTWLYSITHNTCVSYLRKKQSPAFYPGDEHLASVADSTHSEGHAGQRMEQQATSQMVNRAIQQLAPADAEIVTLFYLGEQTLEEIGVAVGMTPNNVKVRLFRARQKLRELVGNPW